MKRIIAMLLLVSIFVACRPTPEVDAVKQKDTNVLIDTVLAEHKENKEPGEQRPAKKQFPDRFRCDETTEIRHVRVVADVPIEVLTDSAFPLVRVERSTLTDTQRLTIYKRLFGTDTLYRFQEHFTRESAAQWIEWLIQEPEKETWMRETGSTEEDYEKAQAHRREELKKYQDLYNSLSDDDAKIPLLEWNGSLPTFEERQLQVVGDPYEQEGIYQLRHADVRWFTDDAIIFEPAYTLQTGSIGAQAFIYPREGFVRFNPGQYDTVQPGASITPRMAAERVLSVIRGVADEYEVLEIDWSNNADTDGEEKGVIHSYGYGVILTPSLNGAHAISTDWAIAEAQEDEETAGTYMGTWEYPRIIASVSPDGEIWGFKWFGPLKISETVSESTPLLPFDEIREILLQQLNRIYSLENDAERTVCISRVQLGLFRIREENSMNSGLLVPVWCFSYGKITGDPNDADHSYEQSSRLLIINAVDGSIIDPSKGY